MKYLFEEFIEIEEINIKIIEISSDENERLYLMSLIKDTLHHKIADTILDELDEDKKQDILSYIDIEDDHPHILNKLNKWINDFEYKVVKRAEEAKKEILILFEKHS